MRRLSEKIRPWNKAGQDNKQHRKTSPRQKPALFKAAPSYPHKEERKPDYKRNVSYFFHKHCGSIQLTP